jgi:peptide/nickel transport system substrate-binding protein
MIPLVRRGAISARSHELLSVQMNAWDSELWNIGEWSRVEYSEFIYLPLINR